MSDANLGPDGRLLYPENMDSITVCIVGSDGSQTYDYNKLHLDVVSGQFRRSAPCPILPSDVSSQPGVLYVTSSTRFILTIAELERLVRRSLRPEEVLVLRSRFGEGFELQSDHYDTLGIALQPD